MKKYITVIFTTSILLLLTACSFQLRGHNTLPTSLHTLYLEAENPYGSFETALRHTLRSSGVTLTETPAQAPVTLHISKPLIAQTNSAIGPSSQSRTYVMTYAITYTLNTQGRTLAGPETLQTSRSFVLNANQLTEANRQSDVLTRSMERDVISQLYNRLHSTQIKNALVAR